MILEKLQPESGDTESHPLSNSDVTPTRSTQNQQDTAANHEDNAESEDLSITQDTTANQEDNAESEYLNLNAHGEGN